VDFEKTCGLPGPRHFPGWRGFSHPAWLLEIHLSPEYAATWPTRAGFYWAKWLIADRETVEGSALAPSHDWDVVYVYENGFDKEADFLRVLVGVESSQSLKNFEWGPGPLTPPR